VARRRLSAGTGGRRALVGDRLSDGRPSVPWDPSCELFERFTQQARQVVVFAKEEAHVLRHSQIGTEHLLLGLLREEEGLAARALHALDVTVERTRAEVVRLVAR